MRCIIISYREITQIIQITLRKIQKFHLISRWEYFPLTEHFRRFWDESSGIHFEYLFIKYDF